MLGSTLLYWRVASGPAAQAQVRSSPKPESPLPLCGRLPARHYDLGRRLRGRLAVGQASYGGSRCQPIRSCRRRPVRVCRRPWRCHCRRQVTRPLRKLERRYRESLSRPDRTGQLGCGRGKSPSHNPITEMASTALFFMFLLQSCAAFSTAFSPLMSLSSKCMITSTHSTGRPWSTPRWHGWNRHNQKRQLVLFSGVNSLIFSSEKGDVASIEELISSGVHIDGRPEDDHMQRAGYEDDVSTLNVNFCSLCFQSSKQVIPHAENSRR